MKIVPITEMLKKAEREAYGVGSFSARNTYLIDAVLRAAEHTESPVIVQISANEFNWFAVTAKEFADRFYQVADNYRVEAVLHLDHTRKPAIIKDAIDAGFTSVMIDASQKEFEENIRITREVVEYAHAKGVAVEAELGRIGATDKVETDNDESLYTDPDEAAEFVARTGVDTLAVSVGTAHGVYPVKNPTIDFGRLKAIRSRISIPLVLHGGLLFRAAGSAKSTLQRIWNWRFWVRWAVSGRPMLRSGRWMQRLLRLRPGRCRKWLRRRLSTL